MDENVKVPPSEEDVNKPIEEYTENNDPLSSEDKKRYVDKLKSIMAILLNTDELEYLGILLYGLKIEFLDFDELKRGINTPCLGYTDGKKIVVGIGKDSKYSHTIGVVLHELLHIMLLHVNRIGSKDPFVANLASDHIVNRSIKNIKKEFNNKLDGIVTSPQDMGGVYFEDVDAEFPNITFEELYNYILKNCTMKTVNKSMKCNSCDSDSKNDNKNNKSNSDGKSQDDNSDNGEKSESGGSEGEGEGGENDSDGSSSGENPKKSGKGKSSGKRFEITVSNYDNIIKTVDVKDTKNNKNYQSVLDTDPHQIDEMDQNLRTYDAHTGEKVKRGDKFNKEDSEKRVKEFMETARQSYHSRKSLLSKGNIPGSLETILDTIFTIELPWGELLEGAILYPIQNPGRKSWMNKNIYFMHHKVRGKKTKVVDRYTLMCGIDSSGSVDDKSLQKFLGALFNVKEYFEEVVMCFHDYIVQGKYDFKKTISIDEFIKTLCPLGRGGTSHVDLFNYFESVYNDDEKNISSIILMTDYESDIEQIYKEYDFIKEIPVIFILNSNHEIKLENVDYKVIRVK